MCIARVAKSISLVLTFLIITLLMPRLSFPYVSQAWVARYNGPGNSYDMATAIAVDGNGNLYVTGMSYGSGTSADYATIKYNPSGYQIWLARYDGPANNYDYAHDIAVDSSGNTYVTGESYGLGTMLDYATAKYDASGNQLWIARYDGPAHNDDYAFAIAVDGDGNVYVTGTSHDSGTLSDYATIKYDASGNQLWVARYDGPASGYDQSRDIAVDSGGNLYVTGTSQGPGTSLDYATVKYNAMGNELWVARYNGPPGDRYDFAIALDVDGNVHVTGTSYGSGSSSDYATIKYDTDGNEEWIARYDGPGNQYDGATAIIADADGNVHVTGTSYGSGTLSDYATIKYDASGAQLWLARYDGPADSEEYATAIALDGDGNVYTTGMSYGAAFLDDYVTVKYDTEGNILWVARYNGPGNDQDRANAIAVDGDGNVYVTGTSYGSGTLTDYATVKYSSSECPCDLNDDDLCDPQDEIIFSDSPGWHFEDCNQPGIDCICDLNLDGTCNDLDGAIFTLAYESPQCRYGLCECSMKPDTTVIPKPGSLGFQATVVNKTQRMGAIFFATNVTTPGGNTYPSSGSLLGPINVYLNPYQSRHGHLNQFVPEAAPVGIYTYRGYVIPAGLGVAIAECEFDFEITGP